MPKGKDCQWLEGLHTQGSLRVLPLVLQADRLLILLHPLARHVLTLTRQQTISSRKRDGMWKEDFGQKVMAVHSNYEHV